jgi:transposase
MEIPGQISAEIDSHGQEKPEQFEIERLRKENAKLRAERDILKKAAAFFAREAR